MFEVLRKPNEQQLFLFDGVIGGWGFFNDHNGSGWPFYRNGV